MKRLIAVFVTFTLSALLTSAQTSDQIGLSMGINKQIHSSFSLSLKYEKPVINHLYFSGIGTINFLGNNARIQDAHYFEIDNRAIVEADNQTGLDVGLKYVFSDTWIQPYMQVSIGFDYYWDTYEYDLIKDGTTRPGSYRKSITRESGTLLANSFSWLLGVQFEYSKTWFIDTYVMDKMYNDLNQAIKLMVGFYFLI